MGARCMHRWWMLSVLLLAIPAQAVEVATDGTSDVQAWTQASPGANVPHYPAMDLVAMEVEEFEDTIRVQIQVADLSAAAEAPILDDTRYLMALTHDDQDYLVIVFRAIAEQDYYWGQLIKADFANQRFTFVRPFPPSAIEVDQDANTIAVQVARSDLTDTIGAHPLPGRTIDNFWAWADTRTSQGFIQLGNIGGQPVTVGQQWGAFDVMPDNGNSTVPLPITMGIQQSGAANLWSPTPIRASNGEANTFVFTLKAEHHGDSTETYEIMLDGVPSAWDVQVPYNLIELGPGDVVDVPVILRTPFNHQHGALVTFQVHMHGSDSANVGRAELGIRYHEVPQPAGHHDRLWFHSQRWGEDHPLFPVTDSLFTGNSGLSYINTVEDDENDQGVPINGNYQGFGCFEQGCTEPESRYIWFSFLQPGLEMGLDFDLTRTGTVDVEVRSDHAMPNGRIWGQFVYWLYDPSTDTWNRLVIGPLAPQAADLAPGETRSFTFDVNFAAEADLLPFVKQSFFGLELQAAATRPSGFTGAEAPQLLGGSMQLPLLEYHDAVDELFASAQGLRWHVLSEQDRPVNTGEVVTFTAMLHNDLDESRDFLLDLAGSNVDWAWIEGVPEVTIAGGDSREVRIAVRAPDSATEGDAADLVLSAADRNDPARRSLVRFVATIDDATDHPDEAEMVGAAQDVVEESPLPLLAPVLALLWAVRRRHPPATD